MEVQVQCFGGKILSNFFQRDVEEREKENIYIEDSEASCSDSDSIVLQEVLLPGDGCKVQIVFTRNAEVSAPVLSQLIEKSIRAKALGAVGFYEQLGFKCDPDGVRGMFWNQ
ncbi:hypothetical protein WJX75_007202 [Coccomyxa subellipsoidea]|uniref:Uncharacterized protein n=1 Tax=Coccomyxa subellipsoidea TaxID=248742 RepID=A0ABR2YRW8_9CHLO